MRDALSLLDQAIAYGGGAVHEEVVRTMLGAVDSEHAYRLVDALLARDGKALLAECDAMAMRNVTFASALEELAALFHRIAVAQTVEGAADVFDDRDRVADYAARMSAEEVQLAYQICVQGRADLPLAPDEAMGFSMTLLRLLAFEPGASSVASNDIQSAARAGSSPSERKQARAAPLAQAAMPRASESRSEAAPPASPTRAVSTAAAVSSTPAEPNASPVAQGKPLPASAAEWIAFVATLKLPGIAGQLAAQSEWRRTDGRELVLAVAEAQRHLTDRAYADKLRMAVESATGQKVRLSFETIAEAESSLAAQERRERAEQKAKSEAQFRDEPFVRDVLSRFDARIKPDSVKPG